MKKLLSLLLLLGLLLSLCPAALAEGETDEPAAEGLIPISTRAELEAIAKEPLGSYYLTADIDLSGGEWTPVSEFGGTLDGRGHTIRGLTIECDPEKTDGSGFGLFSALAGQSDGITVLKTAVVENLTLSEVSITGCFSGPVGALCGRASLARVENCRVTGSIDLTTDEGGPSVGGLIGDSGAVELIDCVNEATVFTDFFGSDYQYSRRSCAGGLVGEGDGTFTRCRNVGAVTGVTAGGILGNGWGGAHFRYCVNAGAVSARSGLPETYSYYATPFAGGIAGYADGDILNCANYGQIVSVLSANQGSGSGELGAGGIVGRYTALREVGIARCANSGTVQAASAAPKKMALAGGIAAWCGIDDFHGESKSRAIEDCLNAGKVQAAAKSAVSMSACAGGIVGYAFVNGAHTLELLRCCDLEASLAATLDPGEGVYYQSSHAYAGGICGRRVGNYPEEVPVRNSFVLTDAITALAVGFSGVNDNSVSQESCEIGGGEGTANVVWKDCGATTADAQMRVDAGSFPAKELYTERGWNLDTVWTMQNSGRPTLRWLTQEADEWRTEWEAAPRTAAYAGYTVRLDGDLFSGSSLLYNKDLAMLSGALSGAAEGAELDGKEITALYRELGFPERSILLGNYGPDDYMYRFSFAHKRILVNGQSENLLVITLCGTQTFLETIGDAFTLANSRFLDQTAYDLIYAFEDVVTEALNEYFLNELRDELDGRRLKILVTGHSLGGAGANLVAAYLTDKYRGEWWGTYLRGPQDIFAYTFGAIDAIRTESPVEAGFENIHNIYNYYDTFGPNAERTLGWFLNAAGHNKYGKFGHIDEFRYSYAPDHNDSMKDHYNHRIVNYIEAVSADRVNPCRVTLPELRGDVDGDGVIALADARAIFSIAAAQLSGPAELAASDLNGDGKVNNKDAILCFRRATGK